jgi:hypothetical protein
MAENELQERELMARCVQRTMGVLDHSSHQDDTMLTHLARSAVLTALVTGATLTAAMRDHSGWRLLPPADGASSVSLLDSNSAPLNSSTVIERSQCLSVGLVQETSYQCGDLVTTDVVPK